MEQNEGKMNKVKIRVSFRYKAEAISDINDIDFDGLETRCEEIKEEVLKSLNFDFCADVDGTGTISDWKVDIEKVE